MRLEERTAVDLVAVKRCGDGVASTADRVVLDLTCGPGADAGLPDRMVLKTMLSSPHAPREMFETEVRFYQEIRPGLDVETPHAFAAAFDPATKQFGLLFEDLSARGARFPDATQPVTPDEAAVLLAQLLAAPTTLLHGDTHIANTYLLADGTGGLLDWQLQVRGCFAHDVIYLLSTALDPDVRRREAPRFLEGYLAQLAAFGDVDAPDPDEAWEWCRRAVVWGLVIGWLITPPENYGVEITVAATGRMVAAVADLDGLAVLG